MEALRRVQDLHVDLGSTTWLGVIALFTYYAAETLVITVLVASVLYGVIYALGPRRLAPTVALIGLAFIA